MRATIATVGALARLQLEARQVGLELHLRGVSRELRELVAFAGLEEALRPETGWEAEERKERRGVEEERELGDFPVP